MANQLYIKKLHPDNRAKSLRFYNKLKIRHLELQENPPYHVHLKM